MANKPKRKPSKKDIYIYIRRKPIFLFSSLCPWHIIGTKTQKLYRCPARLTRSLMPQQLELPATPLRQPSLCPLPTPALTAEEVAALDGRPQEACTDCALSTDTPPPSSPPAHPGRVSPGRTTRTEGNGPFEGRPACGSACTAGSTCQLDL